MSPMVMLLLAPAALLLAAGALLLVLFMLANLTREDVHFESTDGQWADTERTFKGYDYPTLARAFENYRRSVMGPVALVRTTRMDWRVLRLWPSYLLNPKWRVPYSPRTIAADQLFPREPPRGVRGVVGLKRTPLAEPLDAAKLAAEYLDHRNAAGTLVDMLGYIDHHYRVIPTVEEINAALRQRPSVRVRRVEGSLHFAPEGVERAITEADMTRAYAQWRKTLRLLRRPGAR